MDNLSNELIFTIDNRVPYTYLVGWSNLNIWYYGVRYGKKCHPSDLWNPYKTSSKYVKQFIKEHGDPDIIQVRHIFKDKKKAQEWEYKVIKRMNTIKSPHWLNKGHGGKHFHNTIASDETKIKMSESAIKRLENPIEKEKRKNLIEELAKKHRGVPLSEEHKQKISKSHIGIKHNDETKIKLSNYRKGKIPWNKGIPRTDEEKRHISESKMKNKSIKNKKEINSNTID